MHCSKKMICLQNSLNNINILVHIIKGLRNFQANTCERFQNTSISYLNVIPKNKIKLRECDKKTKEVKSRIWALPLLGVIEYKTCIAPDEDHQINDALITPPSIAVYLPSTTLCLKGTETFHFCSAQLLGLEKSGTLLLGVQCFPS